MEDALANPGLTVSTEKPISKLKGALATLFVWDLMILVVAMIWELLTTIATPKHI